MTDTILFNCKDRIAHLVLNNPRRHNALGREQLDAMCARLTEVAADPQVRVLILTGNGEKTFCAGAALQELSDGQLGEDLFQQVTGKLSQLNIPTICALNGNVFGGGAELALSCDFRVGITGMRMRVPAAAIGLCYPLAGIRHFVEILGVQTAKRILVASEEFSAQSLLEIGFLDHLVAPRELMQFAEKYAFGIAKLAPLAVQAMKQILRAYVSGELDSTLVDELYSRCLLSSDLIEGFLAKREKRDPEFEGN